MFHRHLTAIINFFLCVIYPEKELNRLSIQGLYFHWTSNIKIKTHIPVLLGLDDPKDLFQSISSCNSVSLVVRSQHLLPDCGYLKICVLCCGHALSVQQNLLGCHSSSQPYRWDPHCSSPDSSAVLTKFQLVSGHGLCSGLSGQNPSSFSILPCVINGSTGSSSSSSTTPIKGNQITTWFPCSAERPCLLHSFRY